MLQNTRNRPRIYTAKKHYVPRMIKLCSALNMFNVATAYSMILFANAMSRQVTDTIASGSDPTRAVVAESASRRRRAIIGAQSSVDAAVSCTRLKIASSTTRSSKYFEPLRANAHRICVRLVSLFEHLLALSGRGTCIVS
jgi:hypothetical protein